MSGVVHSLSDEKLISLIAEDIVHDVFPSIWRNRKKIQAECLKNYLAAAVKYMTIAYFKKKESGSRYLQSVGGLEFRGSRGLAQVLGISPKTVDNQFNKALIQ